MRTVVSICIRLTWISVLSNIRHPSCTIHILLTLHLVVSWRSGMRVGGGGKEEGFGVRALTADTLNTTGHLTESIRSPQPYRDRGHHILPLAMPQASVLSTQCSSTSRAVSRTSSSTLQPHQKCTNTQDELAARFEGRRLCTLSSVLHTSSILLLRSQSDFYTL